MSGNFKNLDNFPRQMSIEIQEDDEGYLGRECPESECEGYFKIRSATSKRVEGANLHCAYCGHAAPMDSYWTKAQLAYAESVVMRAFDDALRKDLKTFEFDLKPKGLFGIGVSMKLEPGTPIPIRHYQEQSLETAVACDVCGLEYAVFGVFAFCPDCSSHNSLQILKANVSLLQKQVALRRYARRHSARESPC